MQILILPSGVEYRFAGVTYGTNHVMEPRWTAVVKRLPGPIRQAVGKVLGTPLGSPRARGSTKPSLAVWFKPLGTNVNGATASLSVMAMLSDENGVASGPREYISVWTGTPSRQWVSEVFELWPRRSRTLECVLFQHHYGDAIPYRELGRFRFRNPTFGEFPSWTPDPLPMTKPAGDINITLHDFLSGMKSGGRWESGRIVGCTPVEPGEEPAATVRFTVDSPRGTNETWTTAQFYLSDATGNHLKASSWSSSVGRPAHFAPIFWPGENAWRLTTRFKRTAGFPDNDLLVFDHVPLPQVGQTNVARLTNSVHGVECVLQSVVIRPPKTNHSYSSGDLTRIHLTHAPLSEEFAVDLVGVTFDDPTVNVKSGSCSYGGGNYEADFTSFPTNQTHATITYAVQKTRKVEFLVPPNWVDSANSIVEAGAEQMIRVDHPY